MSGGSFNYLCYKDASEIADHTEDIEYMFQSLLDLGYADDVAKQTLETNIILKQQKIRIQAMLDHLEPVWKAMEWWRSGDIGEEGFKAALKKYRGECEPHT